MYIGDEGSVILSNFLRNCSSVRSLNLRGNKISPSGFVSIFNALGDNSVIGELSLEWNDIGRDSSGLQQLLELCKRSQSIRKIDLRNNSINAVDGDILGQVIRENHSLVFMDLRWNALGNKGARVMLDAVRNSKNILKLDLNGNTVSDELIRELHDCLESNVKADPNALKNYENIFAGRTRENMVGGGTHEFSSSDNRGMTSDGFAAGH
jgi:Ran GTPase-activating protein (RanGAP) involved in mRNA processing and transport